MTLPLVSIITPSYNQVQFIEQTIRSVLWQDYPNIEYLVVDGGSTDGSVDIIKNHATESAGGYRSRTRDRRMPSIRALLVPQVISSPGSIPTTCIIAPMCVSRAVAVLQDHPEVGMVYADGVMVDENLTLLDWHRYPQYSLPDLLAFNVLLQPTVFMRRDVLLRAGFLRTDYHLILDHELVDSHGSPGSSTGMSMSSGLLSARTLQLRPLLKPGSL